MLKPIVVIAPSKDRKALRKCGVLPESAFRSFEEQNDIGNNGAINLWPHDITYTLSDDWVARVEHEPVEFSVFLGMDKAGDDEELHANEARIVRLLGSTVVHIVFLDKNVNERCYAEFRSFEEITQWSQQFKAVLDVRFRNEQTLQQVENVLVVVARGGQVQTSQAELDAFMVCVGEDACFKSCFFLDYNLSVADTHDLFHSQAVWDVMVGRLLLAFLLSREQQSPIWTHGGVSLWMAGECVIDLSEDYYGDQVNNTLNKAYKKLPDMLDNAEGDGGKVVDAPAGVKMDLPELKIPESDGLRLIDNVGWADWPVGNFVALMTEELSRWKPVFEEVKGKADRWRLSHVFSSNKVEATQNIFSRSHTNPGVLFKESEELGKTVRAARDKLRKGVQGELRNYWREVVDAEKERRAKLDELEKCGRELVRAQGHYVGIAPCLWVAFAVVGSCCMSIGLLSHALGLGLWIALWLGLFIVLGALSAISLVWWRHATNGEAGAKALVDIGKEADEQMVARDRASRKMMECATDMRHRLRVQNLHFKTLLLLDRIKAILITEIQPATVMVESADDDTHCLNDEETTYSSGRRTAFILRTCKPLAPHNKEMVTGGMAKINTIIAEWWDSPVGTNSFKAFWSKLCHTTDKADSGNFPARIFIPAIRDFIMRFKERIRLEVGHQTLQNNSDGIGEDLQKWLKHACDSNRNREFCSGAITGEHVREIEQDGMKIFVRNENNLFNIKALETLVKGWGVNTPLTSSTALDSLPQLAFFYQTFSVKFTVDDVTRHLTFKEVSDVE